MQNFQCINCRARGSRCLGIEAQITTLTAYRKSLIHECVTGQRLIAEMAA